MSVCGERAIMAHSRPTGAQLRTAALRPNFGRFSVWAQSPKADIRAKDTGVSEPIYDCSEAIYDCPSCDKHASIDEEEACAVCGETFEYEHECARCHGSIPLEDALAGFNEGLCSYCTSISPTKTNEAKSHDPRRARAFSAYSGSYPAALK
jgi:hypothetical protein